VDDERRTEAYRQSSLESHADNTREQCCDAGIDKRHGTPSHREANTLAEQY
jgi:hypothetical protein